MDTLARRYDDELRAQDEAVNAAQTSEILDLLQSYGQALSDRVLASNAGLMTSLARLDQPSGKNGKGKAKRKTKPKGKAKGKKKKKK